MTSKSAAILKALNKLLPIPLPFRGGKTYVASPIYFARGIIIEQTPYKDVVYIRLLRLAFFSQFPFIQLGYSPRIASQTTPTLSDHFEGPPDLVASLIFRAIERENLHRDLATLPDPAEFLEIIAASHRSRWTVLVDRACCHALTGESDRALELFADAERDGRIAMQRNTPTAYDHADFALTLRLAEMLRAGEDITAELRRCCHANALALGFKPAPLPDA